jgi:hypothetical protein
LTGFQCRRVPSAPVLVLTIAILVAAVSVRAPGASRTEQDHSSQLTGYTIQMQPSGASFTIPQGWTQEYGAVNITHKQLGKVRTGKGEWYREYAKVTNAALPFSDCSVSAGERAWDASGISLQVRGYVVRSTLEEVEQEISTKGLSAAKGLPKTTARNASVQKSESGPWRRLLITYDASYGDYGGKTDLDFYATAHEGWTVILVFMHPGSDKYTRLVDEILRSFSWQ